MGIVDDRLSELSTNKLKLSGLPKTWLIDLDGTIVRHNGYLEGEERLLPGVKEFFEKLPKNDVVIILTSRPEVYREDTERFLKQNGLRYDAIIFGLPHGERILINDAKPSGLKTAYAINKDRDGIFNVEYEIDVNL